jgi:hypothetical protein
MTLFKFCTSEGGAKILANRSIFITSPLDLNDPFEMRPAWTDAHSKRHQEDQATRNQMVEGMPLLIATEDGFTPAGTMLRMNEPEIGPVDNQLGIADMHNQGVFREMHNRYRVLCFSTGILDTNRSHDVSDKDILMWAHYADSFHGVCIGIDSTKFGNGIRPGGFQMDYSPTRISLPPSFYDVYQRLGTERVNAEGIIFEKDPEKGLFLMKHNRDELIQEQFMSLLTRKSPAWEYEHEIRMIYDLNALQQSPDYLRPTFPCETCLQQKKKAEQCSNRTYRDSVRLPAEAISAVILGADVSSAHASAILNSLDDPDFAHVIVYWCSLHSDKYVLQYNRDSMTSQERYSLFMQRLREKEMAEAKGHILHSDKGTTYISSKKTVLYDAP